MLSEKKENVWHGLALLSTEDSKNHSIYGRFLKIVLSTEDKKIVSRKCSLIILFTDNS